MIELRHRMHRAVLSGALVSTILITACGHIGVDLQRDAPGDKNSGGAAAAGGGKAQGGAGKGTRADEVDASLSSGGDGPWGAGGGGGAKDASIGDASPPDSGLDAGSDAGPDAAADAGDAGMGGAGPDATLPLPPVGGAPHDAGLPPASADNECSPTCTCPAGQKCDLVCTQALCDVTCNWGSACTVGIGNATEVHLRCAEGAICETEGIAAAGTTLSCGGGGDCKSQCSPDSVCSMDCLGTGQCEVDCGQASQCALTCSTQSRCALNQPSATTNAVLECEPARRRKCNRELTVCGIACP